ncbi:hypothetical protein CR513_21386, partial [Mucuna pruriens]
MDLLKEERKMTHIQECTTNARVAKRYNVTVFPRPIRKDGLVLRMTLMGAATNKLTPNWEGLFRVREEVGHGAFKLEHLDGRPIPRTWNASNDIFLLIDDHLDANSAANMLCAKNPKTHKRRPIPRAKNSKTHKRRSVPKEKILRPIRGDQCPGQKS